ncbi:homoserine kinase [Actinomyces sp. B33]|uniref:homoserine kinase n=1 Tax=Actinomyces sp. B33 TaxID=2942131 RepID=UPI002340DDD3|nr:homoserine kinase [Actinomyces sp. B33]MDC4232843.1 homoserine kinase [Actinomyces sp. B33]
MRLREDFVAVRVPASTANIGPGFDSLGMALDLWDEISVHATAGATAVTVEGEGAGSVPDGEDHLVVRSLRMALDRIGAPQIGIRMRCLNRIPHSRGLGSSASAIVAGIALARALVGEEEVLSPQEILDLGSQVEGHPDNVAPAVLGGATVSWMDGDRAGAVRVDPPESIAPVAFIPGFDLPTSTARRVLPDVVPHEDARFNLARASLLTALLTGAARPAGPVSFHDLLMEATLDRLHQEQRRASMEPSLALVDWLRGAGMAAVVSGAGPTVVSLEAVPASVRRDAEAAGWRVLDAPVAASGVRITRGRLAGPTGAAD